MRIALFDYQVIPNNAIGNCDRTIAGGLADEHDFTVFAVMFENPHPDKIKFVRIPVPKRPLFLLFITYHIVAPIIYWLYKLRHRVRFDIVQGIESNSLHVSLVYSQFCHRAYLREHWAATRPPGLRGTARWLDHLLHSLLEPLIYGRARKMVVPSQGLRQELIRVYGRLVKDKIEVISNPVNIEPMKRPADFDANSFRQQWNFQPDDLVMVFVALGHFERKGFPIVLEALKLIPDKRVKLLVVGGTGSLIKEYEARVAADGIGDQIRFVGTQRDIRPYLWASDLFVFPSSYETFSLVAHEAAAAGLPLLVSPIYGVEEWLADNVNGWSVERKPEALADKIRIGLDNRTILKEMGQRAAETVRQFDSDVFVERWRAFYSRWT